MSFTNYQSQYEISPIILVGGIAQGVAGNEIPITNYTQTSEVGLSNLSTYFAHFKPVPGSMLTNWQIANYPFANSTVAANASIAQPLQVSLLMMCPASNGITLEARSSILTNLQTTLQNHVAAGGTFRVMTPAFTYETCLLTSLRDITSMEDLQVQSVYQWDFIQPLLTNAQAAVATNGLMTKLQQGFVVPGSMSNSGPQNVTSQIGG